MKSGKDFEKDIGKAAQQGSSAELLVEPGTAIQPDVDIVEEPQGQVRDYYRAFQLGHEFDRTAIKAALKDGILTLTIPRKQDAIPRRIEIET